MLYYLINIDLSTGDDMKLIISDINPALLTAAGEHIIISDNGSIQGCTGCLRCMAQEVCCIHDGYERMAEYFAKASEVIFISKCVYGSLSPFCKAVLDRARSYLSLSADKATGLHIKMHDNSFSVSAYVYGENITEQENLTIRHLISVCAEGCGGSVGKVIFLRDSNSIRGFEL